VRQYGNIICLVCRSLCFDLNFRFSYKSTSHLSQRELIMIMVHVPCSTLKTTVTHCKSNTPMETQGKRRYNSYLFTTSALDGVGGQRHAPAALYPRHPLIGGWVGLRAGLDSRGYRKYPLAPAGVQTWIARSSSP
jgi:hypothetical protein